MHTDYQTFVMQTMQNITYPRAAESLLMLSYSVPSVRTIGHVLWHVHVLLAHLRLDAGWILGSVENEEVKQSFAALRPLCIRLVSSGHKDPASDLREVVLICVSILRQEHNIPLVECYRQSIAYLSQSGRPSS